MCVKNISDLLFKNRLTHRLWKIPVSNFNMLKYVQMQRNFCFYFILKFDFNSI